MTSDELGATRTNNDPALALKAYHKVDALMGEAASQTYYWLIIPERRKKYKKLFNSLRRRAAQGKKDIDPSPHKGG